MTTKKSAKAMVAMAAKIDAALDACLRQLTEAEQQYALSYWASHIRGAIGDSYGSIGISRLVDRVESD